MNVETAWVARLASWTLVPFGAFGIWACLTLGDPDPRVWMGFAIAVGAFVKWPHYVTLTRGRARRGTLDASGASPPDLSGSYRRIRAWGRRARLPLAVLGLYGALALWAGLAGWA